MIVPDQNTQEDRNVRFLISTKQNNVRCRSLTNGQTYISIYIYIYNKTQIGVITF